MEKIPWYQSAILRQQIVQMLVAALTLFGVATDEIDLNATFGAVFAGIAAVTALWTFVTRLFKPHPPITEAAAEREVAMQVKLSKQRGFARPLALLMLAMCTLTALTLLPGCVGSGTRAAYSEAQNVSEQAYVLTEQYAALVEQAANLRAKPTTPAAAITKMQEADRVAKPLVVRLKTLRDAYLATKSAQTESELQLAVNQAVLAVADMVRAVQAAVKGNS